MKQSSMRSYNQYFHVYILSTEDGKMIKVGKANNTQRTRHLARMGYAGFKDWVHVATFPMCSDHAATALEAMLISRLASAEYRVPRISWENQLNGRKSYADECFRCDAYRAIQAALELSQVYFEHVVPQINTPRCDLSGAP
ncbi:GIY-YIG nuclease family protein [Pusillimonas noertemannii]|uniref:Meiotically Up-regulated Gene 113 (MUG113) protein n=1 Tax=Pusillimonas noertemannii TaxID=305977 RepID=A0A2U1CI85_9BURK|nr:GIY-YIG nuclease family protein [Pusillimonas noertemannii]NYT70466.1 hypothetical protein [Pusillimonas noertemannii]PVY60666.1 hypothetical protein C7440_3460 [Pusillimonas noertemannii]TFL08674.1 hypothetical protein CSC72_16890 [Pusillimonas noertemannii]